MLWMDTWIKKSVIKELNLTMEVPLTPELIKEYQLKKINETLERAVTHSPFYKERFEDIIKQRNDSDEGQDREPEKFPILSSLDDVSSLPFTTIQDLKRDDHRMLCIPGEGAGRFAVIEGGKGTSEASRRIMLSSKDQERVVDFLYHSLKAMVAKKDKVLILMPCRRPGSAGDLFRQALEKMEVATVPYGPLNDDLLDWGIYLELLARENITFIIGTPTQIANLASLTEGRAGDKRYETVIPAIKSNIGAVLLVSEFIPEERSERMQEVWAPCKVFEYYGSIEMVPGGAMLCTQETCFHPWESELYIEIICPSTGLPVAEGQEGEVVFTTLTRIAMPLIRFRTGALSRWLTDSSGNTSYSSPGGSSDCKSILRKLSRPSERVLW